MTYLIVGIVVFLLVAAFIGQYDAKFGAQNELRKIRKQNERRRP